MPDRSPAPCHQARLGRLVTRTGEKCGLQFLILAFCIFCGGVSEAGTRLLVVQGAGGEEAYDQLFSQWVGELKERLTSRIESVVVLTPGSETAPSKERILTSLAQYATLGARDLFVLFLIGHGSADQTQYRFNIPGPDITAEELAGALDRIPAQVVVLNGTSSSGASLQALSRKNRVVVTATRSGRETVPPRFAGFLVEGLDGRADADKNGSVSILELYQYARQKTAEWYQEQNRLASEHALLDDSGSGKGSENPAPGSADGALAASLMIVPPEHLVAASGASRELLSRKLELESAVEKLRFRKSEMSPEQYQEQLENLMLELARVNRQIGAEAQQVAPK